MKPGGRIEYGGHSHTHWEDATAVIVTHRLHAGHELVIEEWMRLVDDGAAGVQSFRPTRATLVEMNGCGQSFPWCCRWSRSCSRTVPAAVAMVVAGSMGHSGRAIG